MEIKPADFGNPLVQDLLRLHGSEARANSPPGTSFALDWSGLQTPAIALYTVWVR
jgi:putative acetyltransferase